MAINTMDYSGITLAQKQSAIAFLHDSEINEISADPSLLEFNFIRDPMLQDIRVQVRNKKTNNTFSKVIPDYMLNSTSLPTPSLTVSNAFAQATASIVANNNYNIMSQGSSTIGHNGGIVNNNSHSNITANDVTIKGKSLLEFMIQVEERLAILVPNPELEKEYLELADLRMQYMEKERYILDKKKTWELLNKDGVMHK